MILCNVVFDEQQLNGANEEVREDGLIFEDYQIQPKGTQHTTHNTPIDINPEVIPHKEEMTVPAITPTFIPTQTRAVKHITNTYTNEETIYQRTKALQQLLEFANIIKINEPTNYTKACTYPHWQTTM